MGWEIDFSPQALEDLSEAVSFIATDNPDAAERVGNALIDRVMILTKFPKLGSPYSKRNGVRKLVSKPYQIFYRLCEPDKRIEILRYWHAARGPLELE